MSAGRPLSGAAGSFFVQLPDTNGRLEGHAEPAPHGVPNEGEPADERAADARTVGVDGPLRGDSRRAARRAALRAPRWAALCQRPDPPRNGAEQDPQGLRGQVEDDGGFRLAVRSGLRLPRAADRAEGGSRARAEEARDEPRGFPPRLPRLRRTLHRRDDEGVPAPGRVRRLGPPVPHDELPLPGRDRARAGQVRRARPRLQGQEAGALVHPLPHGAGRGGSRVRGALLAVDLRGVPTGAGKRRRDRPADPHTEGAGRVGSHLDDDAVDDSVEPGHRLPSRLRLRGVRSRQP